MNVTFLIGNGFDLACGLKSSYPDVYEEYIKQPSQSQVVKKFKEDLVANKTKEKWGNWSDFEMGMAEYAKNFNNEKELIECVSDFKMFLEKHLVKENIRFEKDFNKITQKFKENLSNYIRKSVIEFYKGITRKLEKKYENIELNEETNFDFINFNYTNVLNEIIRKSYLSYNLHNIHGTLYNNDVILGVDNIEQIKTPFKLSKKSRRVFVKPFLNEENDPEKVEDIKKLIQNSDCICIFGLSLGDSDLTWKNEIINWIKANNEHHIFIFDYECSKKSISTLSLRLNEEEDCKAEKMVELGFSEQDDYSEQIHIPIGKKIFGIGSIIESYYQQESNKTA